MRIRLIVMAAATACCLLSGLELADRLRGGSLLLTEDPVIDAAALAAEGRWAEAKMLSEFVIANPNLGDANQASELARQADVELDSFLVQAQHFAEGAVSGEPKDTASMLGSLSLDLFVIGDIRDIAVQGWREMNDGTGDKLILALSAIGLTTTLAPYLDWAPALMKAFKRSGALSKKFLQALTRSSRQALNTGKYNQLGAILGNLGKAAQRLGPGPLRGVMRSVDDAEDLVKVIRAAEHNSRGTYVLARLFGSRGIKSISKDGKNVGVLVSSIRVGSRITKFVRKISRVIPTSWLTIVFATSLTMLILSMIPSRGPTRKRLARSTAPNHSPMEST